jgi:hypothetical protein
MHGIVCERTRGARRRRLCLSTTGEQEPACSLICRRPNQANFGFGSDDPCAFDGMLLAFFWLSSFSVRRHGVGSSIPAPTARGTRSPFVGVYDERVLIGVSCSLRLHRIGVSWRCPVVSSSAVLSVGTPVSSPISVLAIDLATTGGLKSRRNLIAGANVSPCSMAKRLAVSEGREELTTKALVKQ